MIFQKQKNLKWWQIALTPIVLPVLVVGLLPFAVAAVVRHVRDHVRTYYPQVTK